MSVGPTIDRIIADAIMVFHLCFVTFVMTGGLLALRWRRVAWLHLPAVAWGIYIELSHGVCPLTPMENRFRRWGGGSTYQGSFVEHYITPIVYPHGLTDEGRGLHRLCDHCHQRHVLHPPGRADAASQAAGPGRTCGRGNANRKG